MKKFFAWNSETEYGEPQAWYYLKDGTSIEICHEEYGLEHNKQFYSLRRHCSEKDFENDIYHDTCGVIESYSGDFSEIKGVLNHLIAQFGLEPIKTERVIDLFQRYVFHDLNACENSYARDVLMDTCGATEEEMESLGFGFLITE